MALIKDITRTYAHNVCVCGRKTVVKTVIVSDNQDASASATPLSTADLLALHQTYPASVLLAEDETDLCFLMLEQDSCELPEGFEWIDIRHYFATHAEEDCFLMARAKALSTWRSGMRFCPKCGEALTDHPTLTARECPACHTLHFPKIEPCIITVVRKDDTILLARHVERNQDIWACIAGFVECGESLEHALRRELREEVGIEVTNIRYFGSQSWPFPYQLMIGFTADYLSGDIRLQEDELSDARFFPISDLPNHPKPGSISYQLIHAAPNP